MLQIAEGVASSDNAGAEVDLRPGEPPVINDLDVVEIIRRTGAGLLGQDNMLNAPGWTAADDFAFYSRKCASVYFRLGIRNEEVGAVYPLHNPRLRVDEQALSTGAGVLCNAARNFLMPVVLARRNKHCGPGYPLA
ncbi:M20/M25/M40 family metallo-hydrolase [Mesorhizobium sp. WSM3879]|uniref:M20/M25/M40 family metallo-hydrolase n=1 Tax=Mesorhizobium sp. WSM3879 TaxID=2029406 RepID=UPI001FE035D2|nr:M20/M25/M40 family metallo-hydrolase [Mesorhizobium sp. WSM3879]